jgi:alkylation response protein AidB-like acyl-CoA dehydrogenase
MGTPPPTWKDIAWLRDLGGGPFMPKGVMRVDEGSDAAALRCSAVRVDDGYEINGSKSWITHGGRADFYTCSPAPGTARVACPAF